MDLPPRGPGVSRVMGACATKPKELMDSGTRSGRVSPSVIDPRTSPSPQLSLRRLHLDDPSGAPPSPGYGLHDSGEALFDTVEGGAPGTPPPPPPMYRSASLPPPPFAPPPPGAHPKPSDARPYAHCYVLHHARAQRGWDEDGWDYATSCISVRVKSAVWVKGQRCHHEWEWDGTIAPGGVTSYIESEPIPVFDAPSLGMYHPGAEDRVGMVEDAALCACMEEIVEWCHETHGYECDPTRDVEQCVLSWELDDGTAGNHRHEGGLDDRMSAYTAAAIRVRAW